MKRYGLIFLLISVLSLSGCDKAPDLSSPNKYDKNQLQLSYPGNWTITEEETEEDFSYLAIEGNEALMVLQLFAKEDVVSLDEFAQIFSETTKEALPFGKIVDEEFTDAVRNIMSDSRSGIKELFAMKLLGQNIPHIREYYAIESGDKVLFMISHIPTDAQPKAEPGFELIYRSILIK